MEDKMLFKKILIFFRILKYRVVIFENYKNLRTIFENEIKRKFKVLAIDSHTNLENVKKFLPHIIIFDHGYDIDGISLFREIEKLGIEFQPVLKTIYGDDQKIVDHICVSCQLSPQRIIMKSMEGPQFCKFLINLITNPVKV